MINRYIFNVSQFDWDKEHNILVLDKSFWEISALNRGSWCWSEDNSNKQLIQVKSEKTGTIIQFKYNELRSSHKFFQFEFDRIVVKPLELTDSALGTIQNLTVHIYH